MDRKPHVFKREVMNPLAVCNKARKTKLASTTSKLATTTNVNNISSSILTPATLQYLKSLKMKGVISDKIFTKMVFKAAKGFSEETQIVCQSLTSEDLLSKKIEKYLNKNLEKRSNKNNLVVGFESSSHSNSSSTTSFMRMHDNIALPNTPEKDLPKCSKQLTPTEFVNTLIALRNQSHMMNVALTTTNLALSSSSNDSFYTVVMEQDDIAFSSTPQKYLPKCSKLLTSKEFVNVADSHAESITDDHCSFNTTTKLSPSGSSSKNLFYTALIKEDDVSTKNAMRKSPPKLGLSKSIPNLLAYNAIIEKK